MKLDTALLGVIAIATSSIALKLWMEPGPVTHADLAALAERQRKGENVAAKRAALIQRIPKVSVWSIE